MDYGKISLEELKKGYQYDKKKEVYICNYCKQEFSVGQVFPIDGNFFVAELAIAKHIKTEHSGNLHQLLSLETKYNTLTQNQKNLLLLFAEGKTDKEMAKEQNVTEATIRRQRFTFREKAKQAKFYLAVYEQIFEEETVLEKQVVPIHNNANYIDDRYLITEQERQHILDTFFTSFHPLVLKDFSPKEKKKIVILGKIAEQFEHGRQYSEKEVNQILKPIYEDYMTIRRYLIIYGFMERTKDGARYWLAD